MRYAFDLPLISENSRMPPPHELFGTMTVSLWMLSRFVQTLAHYDAGSYILKIPYLAIPSAYASLPFIAYRKDDSHPEQHSSGLHQI